MSTDSTPTSEDDRLVIDESSPSVVVEESNLTDNEDERPTSVHDQPDVTQEETKPAEQELENFLAWWRNERPAPIGFQYWASVAREREEAMRRISEDTLLRIPDQPDWIPKNDTPEFHKNVFKATLKFAGYNDLPVDTWGSRISERMIAVVSKEEIHLPPTGRVTEAVKKLLGFNVAGKVNAIISPGQLSDLLTLLAAVTYRTIPVQKTLGCLGTKTAKIYLTPEIIYAYSDKVIDYDFLNFFAMPPRFTSEATPTIDPDVSAHAHENIVTACLRLMPPEVQSLVGPPPTDDRQATSAPTIHVARQWYPAHSSMPPTLHGEQFDVTWEAPKVIYRPDDSDMDE